MRPALCAALVASLTLAVTPAAGLHRHALALSASLALSPCCPVGELVGHAVGDEGSQRGGEPSRGADDVPCVGLPGAERLCDGLRDVLGRLAVLVGAVQALA